MLPFPPRNAAMDRIRAGEPALGLVVRSQRSGEVAMIAANSGHDFLFLDLQHGTMGFDDAARIAHVAIGVGVAPLVRVATRDDASASRHLDGGALGIIFPDIDTADQARHAMELCRFAPLGKRSVSSGYPSLGYKAVDTPTAVAALEASMLVVCMIETRAGLANVEAIAAVEGVDVVHIGCNDMLNDMGKSGKYGDPEIVAAVEKLIAACAKHNKVAGVGGERDAERQREWVAKGVRFITTGSDIAYMTSAASARTKAIRAA